MKFTFSFLFTIAISSIVFSQKVDTGKVDFVQDFKVKKLLEKHLAINAQEALKGYRIKIHFGTDKNQAYQIRKDFLGKFPDVPAYAKYDQPNFNVRVGDFRTKLEAYKFLKEVQVEFPSAFLVQDEIEFHVLGEEVKSSK